MAWPVVTVPSGGLPVTEAGSFGAPVEEALNGFGTPVTFVTSGGLPVSKGGLALLRGVIASGYVYLSFPWSLSEDAIARVTYDQGGPSFTSNDPVGPEGIRVVSKGALGPTAWAASTKYIASEGDDSPPLNYNGTYIAGHHGAARVMRMSSPAHGRTVADVGFEWTNASVTWTMLRVVDANTLDFISANTTGDNALWGYVTTAPTGTLTPLSGTNPITIVGTPSVVQLIPAIRPVSKVLLADGQVVTGGSFTAQRFQIQEVYDVMNVESVANYVRGGRPWAAQPAFNDASIQAQCRCTYNWTWERNGSLTLDAPPIHWYQPVDISSARGGYVGVTQLTMLNPGSWDPSTETLSLFIPRFGNLTGTLKTWNFSNEEIISGSFEALNLSSTAWTAPGNPPNRMCLINKTTGGVRQRGLAHGYSRLSTPGNAMGSYATRTGSTSALRKTYPAALTGASAVLGGSNTVPANFDLNAKAYRIPYNLEALPEATTAAVRLYDGGAEVILDFLQNVSNYSIPLPSGLNGKPATVLNSDGGFSLDTPVVSNDQIRVTVTGGKGSGEVKIG